VKLKNISAETPEPNARFSNKISFPINIAPLERQHLYKTKRKPNRNRRRFPCNFFGKNSWFPKAARRPYAEKRRAFSSISFIASSSAQPAIARRFHAPEAR
jgi:hypothetical protein